MNIVFLCTKFSLDERDSWLTNDLADAFAKQGHSVKVCCIDWYRAGKTGSYTHSNGVRILNFLSPVANSDKRLLNLLIKVYKWFFISIPAGIYFYKNLKKEKVDLIVSFSPASIFSFVFWCFDFKFKAKKYLIVWDFFPDHQRALGLIKSKLAFKILRKLETSIFNKHDVIGCMSAYNEKYLVSKYKLNSSVKTCLLPLWGPESTEVAFSKADARKDFSFLENQFVCIFGGQLIAGRGVETIVKLAVDFKTSHPDILFVIAGSGRLSETLLSCKNDNDLSNLKLLKWMPRKEYLKLLHAADAGLVLTIGNCGMPSFPSKCIDFMRSGLPILAAVEKSTDFGNVLESEYKAGLCAESSDIATIKNNILALRDNKELRKTLGNNSLNYYNEHLHADAVASMLINQLN